MEEELNKQQVIEDVADDGRNGDTTLAHLTMGEIVIPLPLQTPELMQALQELFQSQGVTLEQYTVGNEQNSINPETGLPEFFFKKMFKKILKSPLGKIGIPILSSILAPGLGTALSSGLGLGLAAGGTGASLLGGAVAGGAGGALTGGGLKGALKGAAMGGAGGYLGAGGLTELAPQTSNALFNSTGGLIGSSNGDVASGLGSMLGLSGSKDALLGTSAGTPLSGGFQGATQGTGIAGAATRALSSLPSTSSLAGGGAALASGGGGSSFGGTNLLGSLLGGAYSESSNKKALKDLTEAQRAAMGIISPYQATGQAANQMLAGKLASGELGGEFNPGDLTQDPGYQFNLQQGQEALDRQQAAKGNFFSGAALKQAQDYGQGLADNTYNQAYQRYLQGQNNTYGMLSGTSGAGQQAAGGMADLTTTLGSARAKSRLATSEMINQSLASLLAGRGRYNQFA